MNLQHELVESPSQMAASTVNDQGPTEPGDRADGYVRTDDQTWFRIADSQQMPEFFVCPVSSSDHWMFISSRGALSAGRRNPDSALFPYYSSDKLVDQAASTGPKTIIRVPDAAGGHVCWEPFTERIGPDQSISRNLYKNFLGNKLMFEEVNRSLNLSFRYCWSFGNRFGFIRSCELAKLGPEPVRGELLDGIQNVMPYGLDRQFQLGFSNLGDAYKKSELVADSQLGLFYLSSIPTDRAEPSEGLRATIAWQRGLDHPTILLSSGQLDQFRSGLSVGQESDVRGRRGAYFVTTPFQLGDNAANEIAWTIVANVNQDHADVIQLHHQILDQPIEDEIADDVADNQRQLLAIVSSADGIESGANLRRVQRHQSNVLFNVMRGGLPISGYRISGTDFRNHVRQFNVDAYERNRASLDALDKELELESLVERVSRYDDANLHRITMEYLPFTFSRRHGDPTRPWNAFSIDFVNPDGSQNLCYEGNWRDIFQNWEALSLSFPEFCPGMVFRFVNASTADGYNPYRITKDGIDWETINSQDPWANIGYWGDHQIIYLLKLLEWSRRMAPSRLDQWLDEDLCAYAQVPYRIRGYDEIRRNPQETIDYDNQLAEAIAARVGTMGEDGKLIADRDGNPYHVTLAEKLLVPALVKITNFVPGGGVWLNTQRPEWNDANNALVGNGLSMVTACYLRRFFVFMIDWFTSSDLPTSVRVSQEVVALLHRVSSILDQHTSELRDGMSDAQRKRIVDALSTAGSQYRAHLYEHGFSGNKEDLSLGDCVEFFERCLTMIDSTIRSNLRNDGLYHSYNLLSLENDAYRVKPLYEMLEGQVAVLSSGLLSAEEAVEVLDALRASKIYREDQQSYMLYPDRKLPRFLEKNAIGEDVCDRSKLLQRLLADGDTSIVRKDCEGGIHFCGDFRNATDLHEALDRLESNPIYTKLAREDRDLLGEIFEATFHHQSFTGRSGTFFAYEGLGSIYWHMVSKLCLATIENCIWAKAASCDPNVLERLGQHYRDIRDGIGATKTPQQYGAFPSDPYSHTPKDAGVQQPGMTGQVKEDILSRLAELGLRIDGGIVSFDPCLFESSEFLESESNFEFVDLRGRNAQFPLPTGSFAYTVCQTPVIYRRSKERKLVLNYINQPPAQRDQWRLSGQETASIISRRGEISSIEVYFDPESFK